MCLTLRLPLSVFFLPKYEQHKLRATSKDFIVFADQAFAIEHRKHSIAT